MLRQAGFIFLLWGVASSAIADRFKDVEIKATRVVDNVHMLQGAGGNIGVSAGEDGILIIDDQFEPLAERIADALKAINPANPKFIVNTHYHGDHTGGNAWFHKHKRTTVFAHDNVRKRLASKKDHQRDALPVVTYAQGVKFHFNGDTINVMHLPAGHTDGDSVVWFEKANVVHMGDLFFQGRFPYIDLKAGGTVAGYIQNTQQVLDKLKGDTRIIPGHGKLTDKAELQRSLVMMQQTSGYVKKLKDEGLTLEQVLAKGLEKKWHSWSWNFITEEKWITTLYQGQ